jgi:hypothetical protein
VTLVHHASEVERVVPIVGVAKVENGAAGSDHVDCVLHGPNLMTHRLHHQIEGIAIGLVRGPVAADHRFDVIDSELGRLPGSINQIDPGDVRHPPISQRMTEEETDRAKADYGDPGVRQIGQASHGMENAGERLEGDRIDVIHFSTDRSQRLGTRHDKLGETQALSHPANHALTDGQVGPGGDHLAHDLVQR